ICSQVAFAGPRKESEFSFLKGVQPKKTTISKTLDDATYGTVQLQNSIYAREIANPSFEGDLVAPKIIFSQTLSMAQANIEWLSHNIERFSSMNAKDLADYICEMSLVPFLDFIFDESDLTTKPFYKILSICLKKNDDFIKSIITAFANDIYMWERIAEA